MSAQLCSEELIQALVRAFTHANSGAPENHAGQLGNYMRHDEMVETWRVSPNATDADIIGRSLWTENLKSVNARYQHNQEHQEWLKKSDFQVVVIDTFRHDHHKARVLTMVELVKTIHFYQYQSDQHDGWETSRAKAMTDRLLVWAIRNMPEYKAAPWGF